MNGKLYVSAWPSGPKAPRSDRERAARLKFRNMSRATLYMSSAQQLFARDVAAASRLLPRDLLMMALYTRMGVIVLTSGRKIYSMPSIQDVSDLFDAIIQTENGMLYRGPDRWEGITAGLPGQVLSLSPLGVPVWANNAQAALSWAGLAAAQNSPSNAWGKVNIASAVSDPAGWFDAANKRFQPTIAGSYQCNLRVRCNTSGTLVAGIGKNGALLGAVGSDGTLIASTGSITIPMNGTTDTLEMWAFTNSPRAYTANAGDTYMQIYGPI